MNAVKLPSSAADKVSKQEFSADQKVFIRIGDFETFVSTVEAIAIAGRILATVEVVIRNGGN